MITKSKVAAITWMGVFLLQGLPGVFGQEAPASDKRDVVKPVIVDKLIPVRLTHPELAGGEIDRQIMDFVYKNFMVLNLDKDWLDMFKNRIDRSKSHPHGTYYGIGKVLDAGSLFSQYTGDPKVAERANYAADQMRKSRSPDGYIGFWNIEPDNQQNLHNFVLNDQEFILLGFVRNYRMTGDPRVLEDVKIMAAYIIRMFPANKDGEYHIPFPPVANTLPEAFSELYRVTVEAKYLAFAKNVRDFPHVYYTKPNASWEETNNKLRYDKPPQLYIWMGHQYGDLELFKLIGGEDYLKKNLWMKQELPQWGRGMLLVTASAGRNEDFDYDQNGSSKTVELCATVHLLKWMDSMMRLEGDMRYGNIMERTIYNALFGAQSPEGRRIGYFTPFTGQRKFQTIDSYCCNENFRRGVVELAQKVYYRTPDGGIALNLFTGSDKKFDVSEKT